MPAPFRIYSTKTKTIEAFKPQKPGHVGLYVCGMTVYDDAHIGHARAMVTFDAFSRYLRYRGWQVTFVRNYTDVDDKIIARANERSEDAQVLADRFIERFEVDVANLGLLPPDHQPRVSTSIDDIIALIQKLVDRDHAYAAEGSVWFSVSSDKNYGALSGQKVEELRSADADQGKREGADFALWKAAKPGEPQWESPWGPGRPGWHVECSAMAWKSLGETIDIHGGGLDLVFPHHENEVAQSECAHGTEYARYWMHNGLLTMAGGQKMGKSLGNAVTIRELLAEYPSEALRLFYLQNHYRSPLPWGPQAMDEALAMLARLYDARDSAEKMAGDQDADMVAYQIGAEAQEVLRLGRQFEEQLLATLDEDFNTSKALGLAFELARAINRLSNHKQAKQRGAPVVAPALEAFKLLAQTLNLTNLSTEAFQEEVKAKRLPKLGLTVADVEKLLADRIAAREAKDWSTADKIRAILEDKSILVMDAGTATAWRLRL